MRVLVWNSWMTPAGGMERVALSIANGLADRGVDVVLAGPYKNVPILAERVSRKVELVHCDFKRTAGGMVRVARFLKALVRSRRIDVVSAHGSLFPLLALDVPVVWTEHGPRYGHKPILSGLRALPWLAIRRRLRTGAWTFVGCSQYVRNSVCYQLGLGQAAAPVIYNGVPDAKRLRSMPPPAFRAPYRLGFLGRLEEEKFPADIFELDRRLVASGIRCEWHVFGAGRLEETMRRRAAAEADGRVHLHGLARHAAEALSSMDALVFLSHGAMEGLPTVILEARLARRPVVAWDVTANPEAAGPEDVLVPAFDLDAFAEGIRKVVLRGVPSPQVPEAEIAYEQMVEQYENVLRRASARGIAA